MIAPEYLRALRAGNEPTPEPTVADLCRLIGETISTLATNPTIDRQYLARKIYKAAIAAGVQPRALECDAALKSMGIE